MSLMTEGTPNGVLPLASGAPRPAAKATVTRQVSWLPDLCFAPAFPLASSGILGKSFPVTVAGAAEDLNLLPSQVCFHRQPVTMRRL